ncbi:hypothetical protein LEP1GSC123_0895 [Leptospira borgpetersenii str. 200701203]|uniref:Uncharacterized protein n=1 Tax=Leptospira borgpetersenii str. 200701203 TaxID=1193007 RepID=M3HXD4_LEPBO|nr:hypothetical protein LEP1GSC123_0895 [Leptospira borgpetersenii str. 200701203]
MRQHNSPKKQTVLNLQEPHFCDLETNKSNSEYLEPAIRGLRTEDRGQKRRSYYITGLECSLRSEDRRETNSLRSF